MVIPKTLIIMVNILVKNAVEKMVVKALKLKYSKLKTMKWWIKVSEEMNKNAFEKEINRKLNSK